MNKVLYQYVSYIKIYTHSSTQSWTTFQPSSSHLDPFGLIKSCSYELPQGHFAVQGNIQWWHVAEILR